jgi:PAS domain S-box-containing protein
MPTSTSINPKSPSLSMRFLEILIVAAVYFTTAKIGQTLAIPPGNVTPVWIPSGIFLAVVLIRGYYIWPGIFLGAFIGNVWAYIDPTSLSNILSCLFTGTANGIGDVLCVAGAAYLIKKTTGTKNSFGNSSDITRFIAFGAVAGPAVSAIFGVTTLCIAGFLPWDAYAYTLLTWWTGDGVGALVIAPVIITWVAQGKKDFLANRKSELAAFSLILSAAGAYCLNLLPLISSINLPLFSLAPILIWSAFRFGQSITFSGVFLISAMTIVSTAIGSGPFSGKELNVSLLELQWFVAVTSITIFILSGLITERMKALEKIEKAHNDLEGRVKERTADLVGANRDLNREMDERKQAEEALRESEEKYSKLFHSSPQWLHISTLEDGRYMEVNEATKEITGYERDELIGRTSKELGLWADYEERSGLVKVVKEQGGFRDQEVTFIKKHGESVSLLWSAATIEIMGTVCLINSVADITERKQAEEERKQLQDKLQQSQKMEAIWTQAGGDCP